MKTYTSILRIVGFLMAGIAFYHQAITLIFVSLNRSSNDPNDYTFEFYAQLCTLMVLAWFMGSQVRRLLSEQEATAKN